MRNTLKRPTKPNLHGTKLILSRSERLTWEKDRDYYTAIGYSLSEAQKRADDHLMISRQVQAGTFKSKWGF